VSHFYEGEEEEEEGERARWRWERKERKRKWLIVVVLDSLSVDLRKGQRHAWNNNFLRCVMTRAA